MGALIETLLQSQEPSVRYKTLINVLGREPGSPEALTLQEAVRTSSRVERLLSERGADGRIPFGTYNKWRGAHWVLACLADIGYPAGDESLIPLRDQVLEWLFSRKHEKSIKTIEGRARRCASQEGNAIYALLSLGLADERVDELASRLVRWQWPDGGWNCDKRPEASNSSFMESLIPLRALSLHARVTGDQLSAATAERTAEIFLKRRLYQRQRDGRVIKANFVELHYPCYWHYDILFGLKVMAEAGFVGDPRCADALDLLESKRLPGGGFPAEKKYYRVSEQWGSNHSLVDWGGTSKRHMNEFVTVDALYVLRAAGRLSIPDAPEA